MQFSTKIFLLFVCALLLQNCNGENLRGYKMLRNDSKSEMFASSDCPSTGIVKEFHNMLTLPSYYLPQKITFRSCIDYDKETVIADIVDAPGVIDTFFLVTGGRGVSRPRFCVFTEDALSLIIRIYFDGNSVPAIEAPLPALFGIFHPRKDKWGSSELGYGANTALFKLSVNGGFTLTTPMPFAKGCKITIQDQHSKEAKQLRVWVQVTYRLFHRACPFPETLRLHAVYRMEVRNETNLPMHDHDSWEYKRSYHVGHSEGSGYLLGFTIGFSLRKYSGDEWFHNGGEMIILDHNTHPVVMKGTGGEDFFCTSCWFNSHYNFPDWGFIYGDSNAKDPQPFFGAYRFFAENSVLQYKSSFTFDYGANRDDLQSVVFFYQREPVERQYKALPSLGMRMFNGTLERDLYYTPPPGKVITNWRFSHSYPYSDFNKDTTGQTLLNMPSEQFNFFQVSPFYGFISLGEYMFKGGSNEGYPVEKFIYGETTFYSSVNSPVQLILTIAHDDPIEVYHNKQLLYSKGQVAGVQAFDVDFTLQPGQNSLRIKYANLENSNTRAWVLGMTFHKHGTEYNQHLRLMKHAIASAHNLLPVDGSCP